MGIPRRRTLPPLGGRSTAPWKAFVLRSGPLWEPLQTVSGGQTRMVQAMARAGLVELRGTEFRFYRLTEYGVWCRDQWIRLKFHAKG